MVAAETAPKNEVEASEQNGSVPSPPPSTRPPESPVPCTPPNPSEHHSTTLRNILSVPDLVCGTSECVMRNHLLSRQGTGLACVRIADAPHINRASKTDTGISTNQHDNADRVWGRSSSCGRSPSRRRKHAAPTCANDAATRCSSTRVRDAPAEKTSAFSQEYGFDQSVSTWWGGPKWWV